MFFKDSTEDQMTSCKHEAERREEACRFPRPGPDAEADFGWNIYHRHP